MARKKKFIEKKSSVTYRLVPTQNGAGGDAPQNVWVPISNKEKRQLPCMFQNPVPVQTERVFPSKGPRPDWDPDVVAALDDDFDFDDPENALDDDFIEKANVADDLPLQKREKKTKVDLFGDVCSDDSDTEIGSDDLADEFSDEESSQQHARWHAKAKSKTSFYSMTSAVTNCTEAEKLHNEKFEKLLEDYDDDQIGALDFEEVDGTLSLDDPRFEDLMESAQKEEKRLHLDGSDVKEYILNCVNSEKPETYVDIVGEKPIEFDCESILSTYSTAYNHPTVIKSERKLLRRKLTKSGLKQLDREASEPTAESDKWDTRSTVTISSVRPKDETSEEKRERKKIIKEIRKENRAIKKENKLAFGQEKQKQMAQEISTHNNAGMRFL